VCVCRAIAMKSNRSPGKEQRTENRGEPNRAPLDPDDDDDDHDVDVMATTIGGTKAPSTEHTQQRRGGYGILGYTHVDAGGTRQENKKHI